jgi:membrane-associated phospholipid phosphatase
MGLGLLLPLVQDGSKGGNRSLRTLGAVVATDVLTEALKRLTRERRPDGTDRLSFPSGHASVSFAAATVQAEFHPHEAPYWYAVATLISASRVTLRRHYTQDVVAGALLGHFTARWVLKHWHDPYSSETGSSGPSLSLRF